MQTDGDSELADLRAAVSCAALIEQEGFQLDRAQSSRQSQKYRRGAGEIIIVQQDGKGWWDPLRSADDRHGKGDVIRLVQRLHPEMNLGHVRRHLRGLVGMEATAPLYTRESAPDHAEQPIATRWAKAQVATPDCAVWRYLTQDRALPAAIVGAAVRQDALRAGIEGTAWFGHRDAAGALIGAEMRGPDYRGYAKATSKALFRFRADENPVSRLVVCEAAIDALSVAAFDRLRPGTLYVSTGGGMGPETLASLRALLRDLTDTPGAKLVIATDADGAGVRFASMLAGLADEANVWSGRVLPLDAKNDWNAALQGRRASSKPEQPSAAALALELQPDTSPIQPASPLTVADDAIRHGTVLTERMGAFGHRLNEDKVKEASAIAERAAAQAIDALDRFRTGPGREISNTIDAAACNEAGGIKRLIEAMTPDGRHAQLRSAFDAKLQSDPAFAGAYAKAVETSDRYFRKRSQARAEARTRNVPYAAYDLVARPADLRIGAAVASIPGRAAARSMLTEMSQEAAGVAATVEPEPEPDPRLKPRPGPSPN